MGTHFVGRGVHANASLPRLTATRWPRGQANPTPARGRRASGDLPIHHNSQLLLIICSHNVDQVCSYDRRPVNHIRDSIRVFSYPIPWPMEPEGSIQYSQGLISRLITWIKCVHMIGGLLITSETLYESLVTQFRGLWNPKVQFNTHKGLYLV